MNINFKKIVIQKIGDHIEEELHALNTIAKKEKSFATSNEMQQEGKYDTRKIEASYLAGAQARRVDELNRELNKFKNLSGEDVSKQNEIFVGTLVKCIKKEDLTESICYYFLSPGMGGIQITHEEKIIQVISNQSPIGKELMQLERGDSFELKTKKGTLEFEIKSIV